ncbi:MAG: rhodanese-like domain-containing protein [Hyphomonas sp.]
MSDPRDLEPKAVFEALKRGDVLLIDVREPAEFSNQRIHGALLFPLSTFDPRAIPTNPGRQIVFQCGSGKRSRTALDRFLAETGAEAAHLAGGFGAWKSAGLPCVCINPETGQVEDHGQY